MSGTKNERVFSILAGILLLLRGGLLIWRNVSYLIEEPYFYKISVSSILWWCIYIGLGILLLAGKKNVGFLIGFGAATLMEMYSLVNVLLKRVKYSYVDMKYFIPDIISSIFGIATYAVLFILFFLYVIPSLRKNTGIIKKLWFLPVVLSMVRSVIFLVNYFSGLGLLFYIIETAGILFIGLWLKNSLPEKEPSAGSQNPYTAYQMPPNGFSYTPHQSQSGGTPYMTQPRANGTPYMQNQPQPNGTTNKAVQEEVEKLKAYKELLDSGVLTQEEFDAKKKEILGL